MSMDLPRNFASMIFAKNWLVKEFGDVFIFERKALTNDDGPAMSIMVSLKKEIERDSGIPESLHLYSNNNHVVMDEGGVMVQPVVRLLTTEELYTAPVLEVSGIDAAHIEALMVEAENTYGNSTHWMGSLRHMQELRVHIEQTIHRNMPDNNLVFESSEEARGMYRPWPADANESTIWDPGTEPIEGGDVLDPVDPREEVEEEPS